jgi:hypothetical protein
MNTTKKCLAGIVAVILICVVVTGTVSAYNADTACQSANEIISSTNNTTALELVGFYSDYSLRQFRILTEFILNPEETICGEIRQYIGELDPGQELSELILTTVSREERVSYKLSPDTSRFVKLAEPVDFPDPQKYGEKMLLYFKIIGYHGGNDPKNASSLNPADIFRSRSGITPAGILADLFGSRGSNNPATSFMSNAALNSRNTFNIGDSKLSRITSANSALISQTGQHDFASIGSDLIGRYRQG